MSKLQVYGGNNLKGTILASGSKNASLAIIAASVLTEEVVELENIPRVRDIDIMLMALQSIGAKYQWIASNKLQLDCSQINKNTIGYKYTHKLRSTILFLGSLIGRFGEGALSLPGHDSLGPKSIDLHIKGFKLKGLTTFISKGLIKVQGNNKLDSSIYLDFPSVSATQNIMLSSVLGQGVTTIHGVARDPEVVELASFLTAMGGKVRGAGTNVIKIHGKPSLKGVKYIMMPDRMEAGIYLIMAAATKGEITIEGVENRHIKSVLAKLMETGVKITQMDGAVKLINRGKLKPLNLTTMPYPGFPKDLQPIMSTALCTASGTSIFTEKVYKSKFLYLDELRRFGANIKVEGNMAIIQETNKLLGASVKVSDPISGVALLLGALMADGKSEIIDFEIISNSYENMIEKLRSLNAKIK